ncbi:hypothetical protein SteCoe_28694 [Stentor coeruleus]|uniref:Uncharacterized protein n=1 Tax=Stentor coeruleus TaxID=5963 RepID=A0A1R2B7Q2_9CILI|nr:hypothetical protein SteCoe_28694 [Stentor coeruleus]
MDEKLYTEAMKLRNLEEVIDKLEESGTVDVIQETLNSIFLAVPSSKNQIQLLCALLIDEIWKNKQCKKKDNKQTSVIINEEYTKSYTARSSVQIPTVRSEKRLMYKSVNSARRTDDSLVSEFSQSKGSSFSKAQREPKNYGTAPGPGTYESNTYTKDRTPRIVFGNSKRPDHFTKEVCDQIYNPLHYVASKPYAK